MGRCFLPDEANTMTQKNWGLSANFFLQEQRMNSLGHHFGRLRTHRRLLDHPNGSRPSRGTQRGSGDQPRRTCPGPDPRARAVRGYDMNGWGLDCRPLWPCAPCDPRPLLRKQLNILSTNAKPQIGFGFVRPHPALFLASVIIDPPARHSRESL